MTASDSENENNADSRVRAEQQLVHALLQGLHETEEHREARIATTLNRFEEMESAPVIQVRTETAAASPTTRRRRRSLLGLAAAVMIAGFFWNQLLQPTDLDAAVSRVQEAAKSPVTRIYDIRVKGPGVFTIKRGRLHTRSTNMFVGEMEDKIVKPMIFGTDGTDDWFVAGNRSGVLNSPNEERRYLPFLEKGMHRMMLANGLLESLNDDFEVTLSDLPLPTDKTRECSALIGERISRDRHSPSGFRLWADKETGVALHLELRVQLNERQKPRIFTFEYVGEADVDDDFFTLEKHRVSEP